MSKRSRPNAALSSPTNPFATGHRTLAASMPSACARGAHVPATAGTSMRSTCRSMVCSSTYGALSIRTAKSWISLSNRAGTSRRQRNSSASCSKDCSTFLESSLPTSWPAMRPPEPSFCPTSNTFQRSDPTIAPRIRTSRRANESVACGASSQPGTLSGFSPPSV